MGGAPTTQLSDDIQGWLLLNLTWKQSGTGTESVLFSRYDEYQYLKELDIKVSPCIKRVKNHEDTRKSLAESPVDTDLL